MPESAFLLFNLQLLTLIYFVTSQEEPAMRRDVLQLKMCV